MRNINTLHTLKGLAEKELENAAIYLGEMRNNCQNAQEQLDMLINYQHEYRNNLNQTLTQGLASNRWQNYQQFIQTLEKAINQHRQQLTLWHNKVEQALQFWREKKRRLRSWQTLEDRQLSATLLAANRLDQKRMDEFAQRASLRNKQ